MNGSRLPVIRNYWRSPKNVKRENIGAWLCVNRHHCPVFMLHPALDAKLFSPAWHFSWVTGSGLRNKPMIRSPIDSAAAFSRLPVCV